MAAASRLRDACTLVTTGNFVPLTFSKIRMGNRLSSSSLTTNAVISKRGFTSLLMVKTSSGASCRTFSIKLRRSATLDFAFDKISRLDKFAALAVSIACSLFDDLRAFLVQELVTAIGAEKLDLLVPQFLPVAIELAFALGAGYPKNFRHRDASFVWTLHRLGGVDDHLGGHDVVGLRRIEHVSFDVFNDVHVLVRLHARRHGPHDFLFIVNVDVGVDDHNMLDEVAST